MCATMNFSAFNEENGRYSVMDLYLYRLLYKLTFNKSERLKSKIAYVENYLKNIQCIH